MTRHTSFYLACLTGLSLTLAGCGGSSSGDESYPEAYLQFYNGSANSPTTQVLQDDTLLGSSSYGDATSLYSLEAGNTEIELQWQDADGQEAGISELEIDLRTGYKTLLMMAGDFDSPDITEFQIDRSELEDEFYLYALSVLPDGQSYDLYISDEGAPFSQAHYVMPLNYLDFQQGEYWDSEEDILAWPEGDYVLYLTEPGSMEPVFESQAISFSYSSDYVLVARSTTGANDNNLVIDVILNSTNIVANQDIAATSQFRVYSALAEGAQVTVSLDSGNGSPHQQTLAGGELSDFTSVTFGDYQISASVQGNDELGFGNQLITLNQGVSKTLIIFEQDTGELASLEVTDSALPQTFEHEVNVANLIPEYGDIDIYFVRDDETIDTADYKMTSLDYAEARSINLPNDYYSVVAVYEDALGSDTLLYRSEIVDFTQDELVMVSLEVDISSSTGYRAKILN